MIYAFFTSVDASTVLPGRQTSSGRICALCRKGHQVMPRRARTSS
jgi:hypothetical protein